MQHHEQLFRMLREFTPHVWQELRVVGELVGKVFTYEANVVGLFAEEVDIRVVALLIGEESRVSMTRDRPMHYGLHCSEGL